MASATLSGDIQDRMRWGIREGIVIAGILVFWLMVALGLLLVMSVLGTLIRTLQLESLESVYRFVARGGVVWGVVTPLATATTALYVLARVGTVLIDRYQSSADD